MGCDFAFYGSMPSPALREECLHFLSLLFKQTPQMWSFEHGTLGRFAAPNIFFSAPLKGYIESFDYTGPAAGPEPEMFVGFRGAKTDGQVWPVDFMFDISRMGSLCEFVPPEELTEALRIDPGLGKPKCRWAAAKRERFPKAIALAKLGGYARVPADDAALPALLVILKYRFMPQLIVSDDFHFFYHMDDAAKAGGLVQRFAHADAGALCDLFQGFLAGIKWGFRQEKYAYERAKQQKA